MTWRAEIDKGVVDMLKKIALHIGNRKENRCSPTRDLDLRISAAQRANVTKLVRHGLIAHVAKAKGSAGYFLLTRKGAGFLRGEPIPKYAIIEKAFKGQKSHLLEYFKPELHTCIVYEFADPEMPMWEGIGYDVMDGKTFPSNMPVKPPIIPVKQEVLIIS